MGEITGPQQRDGDAERSALYARIYPMLRKIAGACMRSERLNHTLQPTALVAEAYLRLNVGVPETGAEDSDQSRFYCSAARVMRHILVEHARERNAIKRGGGFVRLDLDQSDVPVFRDPAAVVAIDTVLQRLAGFDERAAQVVELRFFAGLSMPETARALNVSEKTVKRDWEFARVWLEKQLRSGSTP